MDVTQARLILNVRHDCKQSEINEALLCLIDDNTNLLVPISDNVVKVTAMFIQSIGKMSKKIDELENRVKQLEATDGTQG